MLVHISVRICKQELPRTYDVSSYKVTIRIQLVVLCCSLTTLVVMLQKTEPIM